MSGNRKSAADHGVATTRWTLTRNIRKRCSHDGASARRRDGPAACPTALRAPVPFDASPKDATAPSNQTRHDEERERETKREREREQVTQQ